MGVSRLLQLVNNHRSAVQNEIVLPPQGKDAPAKVALGDGFGVIITFASQLTTSLSENTTLQRLLRPDADAPPRAAQYHDAVEALWLATHFRYDDADCVGGGCTWVVSGLELVLGYLRDVYGLRIVFAIDAPRGTDDWADELVSTEEREMGQARHKLWEKRQREQQQETCAQFAYAAGRSVGKHASQRGSQQTALPHLLFAAVRAMLTRTGRASDWLVLDTEVDEVVAQLVNDVGADLILTSDTDLLLVDYPRGAAPALLQHFPWEALLEGAVAWALGSTKVIANPCEPLRVPTVPLRRLQQLLGLAPSDALSLSDAQAMSMLHYAATFTGNDYTAGHVNTHGQLMDDVVRALLRDKQFMSIVKGQADAAVRAPRSDDEDGADRLSHFVELLSDPLVKKSMTSYQRAGNIEQAGQDVPKTPTLLTRHYTVKTRRELERRCKAPGGSFTEQQARELEAFFGAYCAGEIDTVSLPLLLFGVVYHRLPPFTAAVGSTLKPFHELPTAAAVEREIKKLMAAQRASLLGATSAGGDTWFHVHEATKATSVAPPLLSKTLCLLNGDDDAGLVEVQKFPFIAAMLFVASPALYTEEAPLLAAYLHAMSLHATDRKRHNAFVVALLREEEAFLDEKPDPRCLELSHIVANAYTTVSSLTRLVGADAAAAALPADAVMNGTLLHVMYCSHLTRGIAGHRMRDTSVGHSAPAVSWVAELAGDTWGPELQNAVAATLVQLEAQCAARTQGKDSGFRPGVASTKSRFSTQWVGVIHHSEIADMLDEGNAAVESGGRVVASAARGSGNRVAGALASAQPASPVTTEPEKPLPIMEFMPRILDWVRECSIVAVQAATGAGKSSMIPFSLLRESPDYCIVVTQPRRIAAVSLAQRVASLLGEEVGHTVGYRLGGGAQFHLESPATRLRFVTTGYLLEALLGSNPRFWNACTHVILDEVHERSLQADMLSLVLKLKLAEDQGGSGALPAAESSDDEPGSPTMLGTPMLHPPRGAFAAPHHAAPRRKLIVMSATIQSDLFRRYFVPVATPLPVDVVKRMCREDASCAMSDTTAQIASAVEQARRTRREVATMGFIPSLSVGNRNCKVDEMYLDQVLKQHSAKLPGEVVWRLGEYLKKLEALRNPVQPPSLRKEEFAAIADLALASVAPGTSVLVFLPGLDEIEGVLECIGFVGKRVSGRLTIRVHVLHSIVDMEEQRQIVAPATANEAKVVLATNIAETSITIPDLKVVIDLGMARRMMYDEAKQIRAIRTCWASQSAVKQRAGRAGRVSDGLVLRMYTETLHRDVFSEFDPSEFLPLEYSVLQVRQHFEAYGSVTAVMKQLIEPPPSAAVNDALRKLVMWGAIGPGPEHIILDLGQYAMAMPIDVSLTKSILSAAALGCASEMIVVASALSTPRPLFQMPMRNFFSNDSEFLQSYFATFRARYYFARGTASDLHVFLALYEELQPLLQGRRRDQFAAEAARHNALAVRQVQTFFKYVQQISTSFLRHAQANRASRRDNQKGRASDVFFLAPDDLKRLRYLAGEPGAMPPEEFYFPVFVDHFASVRFQLALSAASEMCFSVTQKYFAETLRLAKGANSPMFFDDQWSTEEHNARLSRTAIFNGLSPEAMQALGAGADSGRQLTPDEKQRRAQQQVAARKLLETALSRLTGCTVKAHLNQKQAVFTLAVGSPPQVVAWGLDLDSTHSALHALSMINRFHPTRATVIPLFSPGAPLPPHVTEANRSQHTTSDGDGVPFPKPGFPLAKGAAKGIRFIMCRSSDGGSEEDGEFGDGASAHGVAAAPVIQSRALMFERWSILAGAPAAAFTTAATQLCCGMSCTLIGSNLSVTGCFQLLHGNPGTFLAACNSSIMTTSVQFQRKLCFGVVPIEEPDSMLIITSLFPGIPSESEMLRATHHEGNDDGLSFDYGDDGSRDDGQMLFRHVYRYAKKLKYTPLEGLAVPVHMLIDVNVILMLGYLAQQPREFAAEKAQLRSALNQLLRLNELVPSPNDPIGGMEEPQKCTQETKPLVQGNGDPDGLFIDIADFADISSIDTRDRTDLPKMPVLSLERVFCSEELDFRAWVPQRKLDLFRRATRGLFGSRDPFGCSAWGPPTRFTDEEARTTAQAQQPRAHSQKQEHPAGGQSQPQQSKQQPPPSGKKSKKQNNTPAAQAEPAEELTKDEKKKLKKKQQKKLKEIMAKEIEAERAQTRPASQESQRVRLQLRPDADEQLKQEKKQKP